MSANMINARIPMTAADYIAHAGDTNESGIWATTSHGGVWKTMNFGLLSRATDSLSWWIEDKFGVGDGSEALVYMGANDLRYTLYLAAVLKAGYIPFLTSPRNSLDGQISLLNATSCRKFIYTTEVQAQVEQIRKVIPDMCVVEGPGFLDLFEPSQHHPRYPGHHSRQEDAHCLILHTSGSTGIPKPIYLTVGAFEASYHVGKLQPEGGQEVGNAVLLAGEGPLLAPVPFFHVMGVLMLSRSIIFQKPIICMEANKPLNASSAIEAIKRHRPTAAVFPPSLLEDVSATKEGMDALASLRTIFFGGAPLAQGCGEAICKVTTIVGLIGSTEAGNIPSLMPAREDWGYFQWASSSGVDMEPIDNGGLCEMVIRPRNRQSQAVFHTFADISEWRTKDLFEQHPSKKGLWRYRGRRDDIIVLSNGEKINPVSIEKIVEGHSQLKGALVVGQGCFQAGLLIEPSWDTLDSSDSTALVESVWPLVKRANLEAPSHARIYMSKIVMANKLKPFVRSPKGAIIRRATNSLYAEEIHSLYSDDVLPQGFGQIDLSSDINVIYDTLRAAFAQYLKSFKDDKSSTGLDIFQIGADSLDVVALANAINHAIKDNGGQPVRVTAKTIYENSSVQKLGDFLARSANVAKGEATTEIARRRRLMQMVEKYTADLARAQPLTIPPSPLLKKVVVLTGSTGSLGTSTLIQLLASPAVARVYCLNRSANAKERQKATLSTPRVPKDCIAKATFLQSEFGEERFGLELSVYLEMLATVTDFIHAAWPVDFNLSHGSYEETHIAGTRRVVDFAAQAAYKPKILFISSVSSVGNWTATHSPLTPVPESLATVLDPSLSLPQGYAESKHTAEQILVAASKYLGLEISILRAGQLAGSSQDVPHGEGGVWNQREWFPTLIHTSKVLKKLPKTLGNLDSIDWVPMDKAASAVVDITLGRPSSLSKSPGVLANLCLGLFTRLMGRPMTESALKGTDQENANKCEVLHIVNPNTVTWSQLYPSILGYLNNGGHGNAGVEAVEYEEWLEALRKIDLTKENATIVPGLKLIDFYEGMAAERGANAMPRLDTSKSQLRSRTLKDLGAVNSALILRWLGQWAL